MGPFALLWLISGLCCCVEPTTTNGTAVPGDTVAAKDGGTSDAAASLKDDTRDGSTNVSKLTDADTKLADAKSAEAADAAQEAGVVPPTCEAGSPMGLSLKPEAYPGISGDNVGFIALQLLSSDQALGVLVSPWARTAETPKVELLRIAEPAIVLSSKDVSWVADQTGHPYLTVLSDGSMVGANSTTVFRMTVDGEPIWQVQTPFPGTIPSAKHTDSDEIILVDYQTEFAPRVARLSPLGDILWTIAVSLDRYESVTYSSRVAGEDWVLLGYEGKGSLENNRSFVARVTPEADVVLQSDIVIAEVMPGPCHSHIDPYSSGAIEQDYFLRVVCSSPGSTYRLNGALDVIWKSESQSLGGSLYHKGDTLLSVGAWGVVVADWDTGHTRWSQLVGETGGLDNPDLRRAFYAHELSPDGTIVFAGNETLTRYEEFGEGVEVLYDHIVLRWGSFELCGNTN